MTDMRQPRTGTIRPDGKFKTTRQYIGMDGLPVKKQFVQRKGETPKAVLKRADQWQALAEGAIPSPDMNLKRALELWIESKERQGKAPKTLKDFRFIRDILVKAYGNLKADSLSVYQVEALISDWKAKPRTAKKIREHGRNAYNFLIKNKWVKDNPFAASEPVAYDSDEWGEPISEEHFTKALAHVQNPEHQAILLFLRWTSCRPDAARGLLWAEVWEDEHGMWFRHRSKTKNSDRPGFIPPQVGKVLKELPKRGLFVFSYKGRPIAESTLIHVWKRAQEKAGLTPRRLYDLRHMRLTELADILTPKQLAYVGGHASATTTNRYYIGIERGKLAKEMGGK